jgi:hypothetical protein
LLLLEEIKTQVFCRDKTTREQFDHLDAFVGSMRADGACSPASGAVPCNGSA